MQPNGRWPARGRRDDVDLVAVIEPGGAIVTGYPLAGGRGVVKNPKRSQG